MIRLHQIRTGSLEHGNRRVLQIHMLDNRRAGVVVFADQFAVFPVDESERAGIVGPGLGQTLAQCVDAVLVNAAGGDM